MKVLRPYLLHLICFLLPFIKLVIGYPACLVSFGWIPLIVSWMERSPASPNLGHVLGMSVLWIFFQGAGVLLGITILDWSIRRYSRTLIFRPRPIPGGIAISRFSNDRHPAWTNYRLLYVAPVGMRTLFLLPLDSYHLLDSPFQLHRIDRTICGSWLIFTSLAAPLHQAARLSWPEYQEITLLDGRWIGLASLVIASALSPILAYIQLSIGVSHRQFLGEYDLLFPSLSLSF